MTPQEPAPVSDARLNEMLAEHSIISNSFANERRSMARELLRLRSHSQPPAVAPPSSEAEVEPRGLPQLRDALQRRFRETKRGEPYGEGVRDAVAWMLRECEAIEALFAARRPAGDALSILGGESPAVVIRERSEALIECGRLREALSEMEREAIVVSVERSGIRMVSLLFVQTRIAAALATPSAATPEEKP